MSDDRLMILTDQLIRHWHAEPRSGGEQTYHLLATRILRTLPAALAEQVRVAPEEHRQILETALGRLEQCDPSTRDLLRPLAQGGGPGAAHLAAAPAVFSDPLPGGGAPGVHNVFKQGHGLQMMGGSFTGVVGDHNSFGNGTAIGSNNITGSGNVMGSGNVSGSATAPPFTPPLAAVGALAGGGGGAVGGAARTITILFAGANPMDGARLGLDEEVRGIDAVLRQGSLRDRFELKQHWAVRMLDLQQALLLHRPQVLHFSGHGSAAHAIVLEDGAGRSLPIAGPVLAQLLSMFSKQLRCVVLNACYSEGQARAIAQYIECVVGMTIAVGDQAAIQFAAAFYQALAYGADVETAFKLGCIQVQPTSPGEETTPKLIALRRPASEIVLAAP
jgi:hypothetical protein